MHKSAYIWIMENSYHTHIVKLGNSKGVRIPKAWLSALGTEDVFLTQVDNGIMITPAESAIPPRHTWVRIIATMQKPENEPEVDDWEITVGDGLDDL
jgi:antitoxin MazE